MITIIDVSRAIKKIENLGDYEVDVDCVMAGKESLIEIAEEHRRIREMDRQIKGHDEESGDRLNRKGC